MSLVLYYSSATSDLSIKKHQSALKNLLDSKKAHYQEVDLAQMQKEARDAVYTKAGTRAIPLLFKGDTFLGDYEALQYAEEDGKFADLIQ